ncbi:heavy-metal-associated domain-containing protein [Dictyobacter arantiisoli]|uniref:Copper chaperone CopZ n=1 Tax=Dictyobacter arantiisoli TaxID=2014874 RepID=A0A5A5T6W0_9CHLR|nr:heavy-metal-associated domain-containing protein [Dictyobacter arantiisoli]GCF06985.1 copper chaperone CopZ [Dictyobacter arantiisoli]
MANLQDITLSVPDVSCEHCVKTINGALSPLAGVEAVSTDIPTKSVHLRFDASQLSMEKIEAVLDDAGYTISQAPAPTPRTSGKPLNLI